jgi:hypothetical protein
VESFVRTRVLVRIAQDETEWVASAYFKDSAFCTVRAESREGARAELQVQVETILLPQTRAWLQERRGAENSPNCPEGAIRLPIDLWVCKLTNVLCPLQAQVLVNEPEAFIRDCLAPPDRKEGILQTVSLGKYGGFHHVPGRFLCPACEREAKKESFKYHYPWELTFLETCCPSFSLERDWPDLVRRLGRKNISLSILSSALCAEHFRQLAAQVDPQVAAELSIFELEVGR